jgi:hypothetical protein
VTQRRLPWLLALLCALVILRIFVPPRAEPPPALSEAVVRNPLPTPGTASEAIATLAPSSEAVQVHEENDVPGNAFAIRPPPSPPYIAPGPAAVVAKTKIAPTPQPVVPVVIAEAPPPPAPYQAIGTWDDGKGLGVFLASPNGTLLARQGATLQSEYKVTAVTLEQVSLLHIASKREIRLSVPRASNPSQQPLIP